MKKPPGKSAERVSSGGITSGVSSSADCLRTLAGLKGLTLSRRTGAVVGVGVALSCVIDSDTDSLEVEATADVEGDVLLSSNLVEDSAEVETVTMKVDDDALEASNVVAILEAVVGLALEGAAVATWACALTTDMDVVEPEGSVPPSLASKASLGIRKRT